MPRFVLVTDSNQSESGSSGTPQGGLGDERLGEGEEFSTAPEPDQEQQHALHEAELALLRGGHGRELALVRAQLADAAERNRALARELASSRQQQQQQQQQQHAREEEEKQEQEQHEQCEQHEQHEQHEQQRRVQELTDQNTALQCQCEELKRRCSAYAAEQGREQKERQERQEQQQQAASAAALEAAVRRKEAELNEAFQQVLLDMDRDKAKLEASSANLLEGRLGSMQAALDEQARVVAQLGLELEQGRGQLGLTQAALRESEKQAELAQAQARLLLARPAAPSPTPPPPPPPPYTMPPGVTGGGGGGGGGVTGGGGGGGISSSGTAIATPASGASGAGAGAARISFTSFSSGDLALFLPVPMATGGGGGGGEGGPQQRMAYIAFNHGCPHYYVAEDCMPAVRGEDGSMPSFFLGRIFMVDDHEYSGADDGQPNPYGLPAGTQYHTVLVEAFS